MHWGLHAERISYVKIHTTVFSILKYENLRKIEVIFLGHFETFFEFSTRWEKLQLIIIGLLLFSCWELGYLFILKTAGFISWQHTKTCCSQVLSIKFCLFYSYLSVSIYFLAILIFVPHVWSACLRKRHLVIFTWSGLQGPLPSIW